MKINQILELAENLHRGGELQEAGERYGAALKQDPENADAHYGLGTILMQQKKYAAARKYLQKATLLLPDVPEFLFNLALVEELTGEIERAGKTCLRAAYCARNDRGFLLPICKKLIDLDLAPQAFSYLDALPDKTPAVRLWQARAQGAMGLWGGTLKILKSLTQQFPDDAALWREQSTAAGKLRDYETAIESFHIYMAKKQVDGQDWLALADLYLMARRSDDAMTTVQKAIEGGVDDGEAFLIAGKCARLKGNNALARENLEKAIERRPAFGQAWQLLLEILGRSELSGLADRCAVLEKDDNCRDKDRITLALAAGHAYERSDRYQDAFRAFVRANHGHKDLMARRGVRYHPEGTEAENNKITGYYPKGADYRLSTEINNRRPVFIVGMPRTGTTLVEKILGGLEGVATGGENEAMEFIARQYYRELDRGDKPAPAFLTAGQLAEMARAYWQRTPCDSPVITDKMPHNFHHAGLICQIFPQAPIIYMTRDPRDVCLSIYCRRFPDVHSYATDLGNLGHFYATSERLKAHWKETFPDRLLEVVYEDLVENPVEKTREIAAFCRLDWQPECLDFHKRPGTSFTFSELQVRKPLNREGIGRWRHYEQQLQPLTDALKKYGVL